MNDSELDKLLRSAGNELPLPVSFNRTVWQRIESSASESFGFRGWLERVSYQLTKPLAATTAVIAMTALGLGLGADSASHPENLKTAYVQSVSPFMSSHE